MLKRLHDCIKFAKTAGCLKKITIGGQMLIWKDSIKLLGNHLNYNLDDEKEIQYKQEDVFNRVNLLQTHLYNAPDNVKLAVFNTKCCHFYGCAAGASEQQTC